MWSQNGIFKICQTTQSKVKRQVIEECDDAFLRKLTERENYETIFHKIDQFADFFTVYVSDEIIGYAAMYANDLESRVAYISMIGIKKQYQGMHIGSKLIETCIDYARSKKMQYIRLEVLACNNQAIAFYEKHHFTKEKDCSENSIYMLLDLKKS